MTPVTTGALVIIVATLLVALVNFIYEFFVYKYWERSYLKKFGTWLLEMGLILVMAAAIIATFSGVAWVLGTGIQYLLTL